MLTFSNDSKNPFGYKKNNAVHKSNFGFEDCVILALYVWISLPSSVKGKSILLNGTIIKAISLQKPQVILCTASPQWSILTIITDVLFPRHTAGSNEDYFSFRVMASRLLHLIESTILLSMHNSQIFNFITESFGDVPIAHIGYFEIRCLIENISCENVVLDYLSHWLHATMH